HGFLDVDRHPDAQRDGHRIRWPRRDLDIAVEDQVGVEGALLQIDDAHLFERMAQSSNQIPDEVMGERSGRLDTLLLLRDRGGLGLADPDRQVAVTIGLAQQQHRLILGLLHTYTDYPYLTHQ